MSTVILNELLSKRQEPLTVYRSLGRLGWFVDAADEKKRYKGITKDIERAYFPNKKRSASRARTKDSKVPGPTGMALGKLVDKELQQYTTYMRTTNTSLAALLKNMTGIDPTARPIKVHPRTLNFFRFLQDLGVVPIVCQLSVACEASRRSTMIDMVCWNPTTKKWLVIECKSGYNGKGYQEGKIAMHEPFAAQVDCDYHRHQLQLLLTTLLFKKTFNLEDKDVDSLLVRVINDEIHHYPLEQWVLDCQNEVTKHFMVRGGLARHIKLLKLSEAATVVVTKKKKPSTKNVTSIKKQKKRSNNNNSSSTATKKHKRSHTQTKLVFVAV